MKAVAVIPARLGSSRFPGKPLAPILGRPMLQWVYEGTRQCDLLNGVYVATCDREIEQAASRFGAPVLMTSAAHARASDRVAEAATQLVADVVVMVQGDEPMVTSSMVRLALEPFRSEDVVCTNLAAPIEDEAKFRDPNTVKLVTDRAGRALYFSREGIPSIARLGFGGIRAWRQVCVIGFRAGFLQTYAALEPTAGEIAESIDMLRALEHGYPVHIVQTMEPSHPVDTAADLGKVESLLRKVGRA